MGSQSRIRVVQYGLGPIGLAAVRNILTRRDLELVGAIDIDPRKFQRDVADLSGLKQPSGVRVSNRPEDVLAVCRPDVVLHATGSRLESVFPQLSQCVETGASVVSTCEELLLPDLRNPKLTEKLDRLAKLKQAVVLGTGVNPGFVMDTMAVVATAPCLELKSVQVERVVDASTRRLPLQKKVGAGMTSAQFRKGVKKKELGHVGLLESLHLVARGLGWSLDRVVENIKPVLAKRSVRTRFLTVKSGQVAGIHHVCRGYRDNKAVLSLDLQMYVGARKPHDRINIQGRPAVNLLFDGGVAGDEATVGMLLSMAHVVRAASPGVRTMIDVPLPRFPAGAVLPAR